MRTMLFLIAAAITVPSFAQQYETPEAAKEDPDFLIQGEYVGESRAMQVVALGDGEFDVVIYQGGLPGAGWDKAPARRLTVEEDQVLDLADANGMERVQRKSPTLGLKPPAGAVVLFDGTKESIADHWNKGAMTSEGFLKQGTTSKDKFTDFTLHIEFRTPFKPAARGQGRGNSGVYYQGRYETQVLDSFGLAGKMNETGGIYSIRDPDFNMCFPPLQWQTYDGEFIAARFDDSGKKISDAVLTVRLNGVVVQQNVKLTHKTTAAPVNEGPEPGPIYLQDHGNPVAYRNIWVKPRDIERESRRPIVPGFERFYAQGDGSDPAGGHLLINELGCAKCHDSAGDLASAKQAPILDSVGGRVRPDYLLDFISNPHATKAGTTMPDLLGGLPESERQATAEAITNFLLSTGSVVDRRGNPKAARSGKELFHSIGCTACHEPQDGSIENVGTSVPIGNISLKYTFDSLTEFLKSPHAVRPSGRMPDFALRGDDAANLATYLLRDAILGEGALNMKATFYEGRWEQLPDFDQLKPVKQTETFGLEILALGKRDGFGVRFDTFFFAPKDAKYKFRLGSDDGSRLLVDGKQVIGNDGVHPMSYKEAEVELKKGKHQIRVEYFENGGEELLALEVSGGGISRSSIESLATLDESGSPPEPLIATTFKANPSLVDAGRKAFVEIGCASCHQLKDGKASLASQLAMKPVRSLDSGCMSEDVKKGLPNFDLTAAQRSSIRSALASKDAIGEKDHHATVHLTMASMNCYACHARGKVGGPEGIRDQLFKTTIKEMGDEGRLPPALTGVGDKLKANYIRDVLDKGADERPYMRVNMPGFGEKNVPGLIDAFVALDQKSDASIQRADQSQNKIKAAGRKLVGSKGLSCVKCHVFGNKSTPGIRAIDMQRMTTRLREDWFHRYLMSPETYRPGTRMPGSFPEGKSVLPELLEGHPSAQIDAMWAYLLDGGKAREPLGLGGKVIELVATKRPVIYRNFIAGMSPRAIAIGYPEQGNLAWDGNTMALTLLWKGAFIDAGRHWIGRGQGNQEPLGDEVVTFEKAAPIAILNDAAEAWPTTQARDRGYRFLGYRLNKAGQPTFRYQLGQIVIEDSPIPVKDEESGVKFLRQIKIAGSASDGGITFRAAAGKEIEDLGDGWFLVNKEFSVKVAGAKLVQVGDSQEVRKTIDMSSGTATIEEEIRW